MYYVDEYPGPPQGVYRLHGAPHHIHARHGGHLHADRVYQHVNQLFLQLKKNAETDYLTSLHNLRQFGGCCRNVFSKPSISANGWVFLSWTLITSKINDTYGHAAGDAVLRQLSKVMREHSRSFDEVSRNGGKNSRCWFRKRPSTRRPLLRNESGPP